MSNFAASFKRIVIVFLLILLVCKLTPGQISRLETAELDGVYGFVSEKTMLVKPKRETTNRSAPEWGGMWQLRGGHFSTILVRKKRTLYRRREKYDEDFNAFAGIYSIENNEIVFSVIYALGPAMQETRILTQFEMKGDELILTQLLRPRLHESLEGTVVTTLRKMKPGALPDNDSFPTRTFLERQ